MRIKNLFIGDIRFQNKYGFYMLYLIFTLLYIAIIYFLPALWRENASTIFIFTDPTALGLFFIGSIVLLEKSQRVLNSIAVSPVKTSEYILSKLLSLGTISTVSGSIIAFSTGKPSNVFYLLVGLFLGSCLFTLFGLIISSKTSSVNHFLIATTPIQIIMIVPAIIYLFFYKTTLLLLHPGVIILELIRGSVYSPILVLLLCIWIIIFYKITYKLIDKMIKSLGGARL